MWKTIALVIGAALLALFFWIERCAFAPLVAIEMLALPSVRWGNVAALTIFSMEAGLIYLVTLYLQEVLHLGPVVTGLVFGVPGLASIVAGILAGRIVAQRGARPVLLAALLVQGGLTAPLLLLGPDRTSMWLLIPSLFVGFFGHITAVVAATVAATSGVPEASKSLASGLMTTSQRVASTIGIPALAAVMAIRPDLLSGIHIALATDVVLTVIAVAMIAAGLKQRQPAGNPSRFRIAVYRPMQVRAGSVSSCSTGVPSSGRIGQVGQDDLRKWQNATKTALPLFDGGWL